MTTVSIVPPVDSRYREKKSYPNDLEDVATNSRMTYYLTTQNLYIQEQREATRLGKLQSHTEA